jgi:biopolymer transport protein ExbD
VRRKKGRGDSEDNSEIDLTPMLDVVFIMLIFFIVTASFVKESTIDVNVPENQENTPPDPDSKSILVEVKSNDEIWMEQRRVDIRAIRANIERLHAESPDAPVIVKADAKASAKSFVAIADAAREAGIYNVSLARPEPSK